MCDGKEEGKNEDEQNKKIFRFSFLNLVKGQQNL